MASTSLYRCSPAIPSLFLTADLDNTHPLYHSLSPNSVQTISTCISRLPVILTLSRSRFPYPVLIASKRDIRVMAGTGLMDGESVTDPEPEADNSDSSAAVNLQLPRRSLIVQFTCNLCGEKTERLVNKLAYERGAVFVQCAGCLRHHKLVDNLGLIVEYNFREETSSDFGTDQV